MKLQKFFRRHFRPNPVYLVKYQSLEQKQSNVSQYERSSEEMCVLYDSSSMYDPYRTESHVMV